MTHESGRTDLGDPSKAPLGTNPVDVIGRAVGNYVIERPLAQGAMGSVFVARHQKLGRTAAVKFLDAGVAADPSFSSRFFDEAKVTAGLRHPNVIDIFDFGDLDGRLYYVMELLEGRDLSRELAERGPLEEPAAVQFLLQMCSGLGAAHAAGIIHRDLKPANIFVSQGPPQTIKLMDFGVAKILAREGTQTTTGQVLGTPAYMAPEQAMGDVQRITSETDIYALGAIAYEMLTGHPPFIHSSAMMLLVMHIHEPPAPIASRRPGLHPELCSIIDACLRKDPVERPPSSTELARRLADLSRLSRRPPPPAAAPLLASDVTATVRVEAPRALREERAPLEAATPSLPEAYAATLRGDTAPTRDPSRLPLTRPQNVTIQNMDLSLNAEDLSEPTEDAPEPPPSLRRTDSIAPKTIGSMPPSLIAPLDVDLTQEANERPQKLSETDRDVFNKLLARMQRKGDLPAFVANVGEVNTRADHEGKYSARQLSSTILKDYALTAKLLRMVNTMYANRFGGRIYTVQHAIVILGFERVRSLALSVTVFNKNEAGDPRVSDSAIHALVSGEIARELAETKVHVDPEQAMVCAMFRNLGRHLVVHYLPNLYEEVLVKAQGDRLSEDAASQRVLGISFRKIGMGVSEEWNLPKRVTVSMSSPVKPGEKPNTPEERLTALSQLSNELSDLVAAGVGDAQHPKVQALLERHKTICHLDTEGLQSLLARVDDAFRTRYAVLLGRKVAGSQFLSNLRAMRPAEPDAAEASPAGQALGAREHHQTNEKAHAPHAHPAEAKHQPPGHEGSPVAAKPVPARAVRALALGESPAGAAGDKELEAIQAQLARGRAHAPQALSDGLDLLARRLKVQRVLVLAANDNASNLQIAAGRGADVAGLGPVFRPELKRNGTDVFSRAFHQRKDYLVKDTFSKRASAAVPQAYYEAIGAPAFALVYCGGSRGRGCLVLVDVDHEDGLPTQEQFDALLPLRKVIAEAL